MEQNTVILTVERYDELKELERVVKEGKETVFFKYIEGNMYDVSIFYNSNAQFELVEMNNSLKTEINRLNKLIQLKDGKIKELSKPKRTFLSKWF